MANEYQGASYGTIYQPSSNAVDNLLQVAERQKQDKINEQRYKARLDEEQKKQQGAIERYAGTLMGGKQNAIDPNNPYAPMLAKELSDAKDEVYQALKQGGMSEGMVANMIQQRFQTTLDKQNRYNAVKAKIKNDAMVISKAYGIDLKMAETLMTTTALYDEDEKGVFSLKNYADLNPEDDFGAKTFTGENAKKLPDFKIFTKDKLTDEDFTVDTKNAKGELVSKRTKATYNKDLHEIITDDKGNRQVIPRGAVPLVDAEKKQLEMDLDETENDPKTGKPKLDADGKPIKKKIPLMVFTPERYAQLVSREPQLELQMIKELQKENANLKKQGLPILEDDMADLFKRTYATTKIPQGSVIDGGEKNLTQRAKVNTAEAFLRQNHAAALGWQFSRPSPTLDERSVQKLATGTVDDKVAEATETLKRRRAAVGQSEEDFRNEQESARIYLNLPQSEKLKLAKMTNLIPGEETSAQTVTETPKSKSFIQSAIDKLKPKSKPTKKSLY